MATLICYDITNDTLRTKIGNKIIESGLDRINKSVYLGSIGESALNALTTWLNNEMQQRSGNDDSIIVLPVSASQVHEMLIIGTTNLDKDELTGDKTTLII